MTSRLPIVALWIFSWLCLAGTTWAQEGGAGATSEATESGTTTAAPGGLFDNPLYVMLPVALVMLMFMVMRPQSKDQAKRDEMLKQLKKNDRVVTAGGIVAKVQNVNTDQKTVKLLLDEKSGSTMTVTQEAISRVVTDDDKVETKES